MALLKCPECELPVSDKALSCPHCGFPINTKAPRKKREKKHKRLPNGFGSITKLSKPNLRNPYWARVCTGKDSVGKYILKPLKPQAYFATYEEAYYALSEYNRNPYDLDDDISVKELYERWSEDYFKTIKTSSQRTITSAWAYCSELYDMRAKDVRARHIKGVMENGTILEIKGPDKGKPKHASSGTQARIKSLFNLMYDYALEYEIVTMNYARTFDVPDEVRDDIEKSKRDHIPFTEKELSILWDNIDKVKFVDWVLIQSYMGWRPQEIAIIRLDEINLDEWYMQAGIKTDAGKQRIVPIHSRIRPLVQKNYDFALSIGSEYFINDKGQTHSGSWKMTYDKYADRFKKVVEALNLNPLHRAHDPRTTFVTRCKKAGIDAYAVKCMVGHKIKDITEAAYTKRDIEWLRTDIEKLE